MDDSRSGCIFVVDDDETMRGYVREVLSLHGYSPLLFPSGNMALCHLATTQEDVRLIISDIGMPGMSGVELLQTVKAVMPEIPFILLSGLYEKSIAVDALRMGATDYLLKPALPEDITALVRKHLRKPNHDSHAGVRRALASFLDTHRLSGGNSASLLVPLFEMLGIKRFETLQHSQRVAAFARLIGVRHGLGAQALQDLEIGALLHDIGKAAIPHNVLMKPCGFNDEEWRVMKTHALIGAELLASIPGITAEAEIVYCHHERVDGNGYPRGLTLEDIPLGARIFAVSDTLDAITSDRPYRPASSIASARREIGRVSGTDFDPLVVKTFRRISDREIEAIRKRFPDQKVEARVGETAEKDASREFIPEIPDFAANELAGVS